MVDLAKGRIPPFYYNKVTTALGDDGLKLLKKVV
jgi:hypothetical protein